METEKCWLCKRFFSFNCPVCVGKGRTLPTHDEQESGCWKAIVTWCLSNDARVLLSFGAETYQVALEKAGQFKRFQPSDSRLDALSQAAQWCAFEKV